MSDPALSDALPADPLAWPRTASVVPGALVAVIGQYSDRGRKPINQDAFGAVLAPAPADRALKGVAVAIADGITTSDTGHIAAQSAIQSFLNDYYCTPDAWSVKTSAYRVIAATNAWLYAQSRQGAGRYDRDKGYVCAFSALVIKSTTAHLFHVGDARIYRLVDSTLEQLTVDHRIVLSSEQRYLGRALGVDHDVEIDYRTVPVEVGDVFVLTTDGVHEFLSAQAMAETIRTYGEDLDAAAEAIVDAALRKGSEDNLTVQIVRVVALPLEALSEAVDRAHALRPAPILDPPCEFEGYRVLRTVHTSSRSHLYLAEEPTSGHRVVLKIPSQDLREDPVYCQRLMMESWVARRVNSAHLLKPAALDHSPRWLFNAMQYIEGQTLTQWMADHPKPELVKVRVIVEQIARGLRALHRLEMLHQDLRPDNIMIDRSETVCLIDYGSVRIAGVIEASPLAANGDTLGTAQYTAPEYVIGATGTPRSDLYALGVITYQLLTGGKLPYGARMARARTRSQQRRVIYTPATVFNTDIPLWLDATLKKAVNPDPSKRHAALSEFVQGLHHPDPSVHSDRFIPLLERDPLTFWKAVALFLVIVVIVQTMGLLTLI